MREWLFLGGGREGEDKEDGGLTGWNKILELPESHLLAS